MDETDIDHGKGFGILLAGAVFWGMNKEHCPVYCYSGCLVGEPKKCWLFVKIVQNNTILMKLG